MHTDGTDVIATSVYEMLEFGQTYFQACSAAVLNPLGIIGYA
jgi:hypothetical protein